MSSPGYLRDSRVLFLGLVNNLKHLAALKGVSLEAIQWLLSEQGRPVLERLVETVKVEWDKQFKKMVMTGKYPYRTREGGLEIGFCTWVPYDRETLHELSQFYLYQHPGSSLIGTSLLSFAPLYCAEGVARIPRMVGFDFLDIHRKEGQVDLDEVLYRMHRAQVRPALPEEMLSLYKAGKPNLFYRQAIYVHPDGFLAGITPVYAIGAACSMPGDREQMFFKLVPEPSSPFGVRFLFEPVTTSFPAPASFLVVRE